jgi:subtilase family serine protease
VLITASSGDSGYGVEYPAASPDVLAVGGTRLIKSAASRGWSESAWSGGGSGCSAYAKKPEWQSDACAHRTVADLSAVADPDTGVAVYCTYADAPGWAVFGGTSVASPLVAGILAFTGHAGASAEFAYANPAAFHDLKSGSNGTCAGSESYLCKARSGYDGPTGLGSPNGKALAAQ